MSEASIAYEIVALSISGVTALGVGGGFVKFWISFATRVSKAESTSQSSLQEAAEARTMAASAHERITVQAESFGLYRERVARDYVSRDILREMEERLGTTIRESAKVSSDAITHLSNRLDQAMTSMGKAKASG